MTRQMAERFGLLMRRVEECQTLERGYRALLDSLMHRVVSTDRASWQLAARLPAVRPLTNGRDRHQLLMHNRF